MKIRAKHLTLARDIRCIDPRVMYARTPEALRDFCDRELRRMGYEFVVKKNRDEDLPAELARFSRMTTIGVCRVWLGSRWDDRSAFSQAAVLAHELVHAHQARVYGTTFQWRYLMDARWRWAYEMQANRQELAVRLNLGWSRGSAVADFRRLGEKTFREAYFMGRIDRDDLEAKTMMLGLEWIREFFGE